MKFIQLIIIFSFIIVSGNAMSQSYLFQPASPENIDKILSYHIYFVRLLAPDDHEFYLDVVKDEGEADNIGDISKVSEGADTIAPINISETEKQPVYSNYDIVAIDNAISSLTDRDVHIWSKNSTELNFIIGTSAPTIVYPDSVRELSIALDKIDSSIINSSKFDEWLSEDLHNFKKMIHDCAENGHGYIFYLQ
tara:strand:+ start:641 stop:1222 length:582 start_codon:yes stop_codon:yes gene_type:complete